MPKACSVSTSVEPNPQARRKESEPSVGVGRWLVPAILALLILASSGFLALRQSSIIVGGAQYNLLGDDAMISMRYAYNLAHGHGLVWNVGDRVQGYTNPGWTLVMAAVHLLGLPLRLNSLCLLAINVGLHAGLALYVFFCVRQKLGSLAAAIAALLVGYNLPLLAWTVAGFETSLQALLVTVALLRFLPIGNDEASRPAKLHWAVLLTGLTTIVRPDGAVLFAAVAAVSLGLIYFCPADRDSGRRQAIRFWAMLFISALLIVGMFAAQKHYYGDWAPNTFRLKATGAAPDIRRIAKYWIRFVVSDAQGIYLLCAGVYLLRGLARPAARMRYAAVAAILVGWFAFISWTGGDVFRHSRFFIPVIPLLIVATVAQIHRLLPLALNVDEARDGLMRISLQLPAASTRTWAAIALLMILATQPFVAVFHIAVDTPDVLRAANQNVLIAAGLRDMYPRHDVTIGVFWAGTTPYLMPEYRFHDMLGKSDRHIASVAAKRGVVGHNKYDYDYSLIQVAPDVLITTEPMMTDERAKARLESDNDFGYFPALMLHPEFKRAYAPHRTPIHVGDVEASDFWVYTRAAR